MTRTILSLVLAFGLFLCIGAVSGGQGAYADDFVKKYAGKYYNTTNTTAADDETATDEAPVDDACAKTLNKTNEAIAQFAETVGTAKDKWSLLGSIQRLGGQKYSLQFNCKPENLKFENVGEVGVNKTQDEACDKLIEIIQPLLNKTEDGGASSDGGFGASLKSSQEALSISKKLGDKCKVALIDITQKTEEEETVEELVEEWESLEEEDDDDDLVIEVVDDEGDLKTIYPVPSDDVESEVEEDLSEDEEEASDKPGFLSFVQSKDKVNATKPNPWADVDYKAKYAGNYTAPPTLFAF